MLFGHCKMYLCIFHTNKIFPFVFFLGIVHENPRIGSDGESEEVSGTSDEKDDMVSPVKLRVRARRFSEVSGISRSSTVSWVAQKSLSFSHLL